MGKNELEIAASPVSHALIAICEKCGRKMSSDDDTNPSRRMQKELKSLIKDKFGKGYARAVTSSCLDICPKDKIAVSISYGAGKGAGNGTRNGTEAPPLCFYLVDGKDQDADVAAILEKI